MRAVACAAAAIAAVAGARGDVLLHRPSIVPEGWAPGSGAVDRAAVVPVVASVRRSADGRRAIADAVRRASTPGSPHFLQHLSWEEAGELARPPAARTELVREWLLRHGAADVAVHPHGDSVSATLTVAALERMSGGAFASYRHTSGRELPRLTTGVRVPEEIADALDAFTGFHGFPLTPSPAAQRSAASAGAVNPSKINEVYNIPQLKKSGKPNIQAMAQFQGQYVSGADLSKFCLANEPSGRNCSIAKYVGSNGNGKPGVESMLDTEYMMGLGQGTETWVYSYPSMDFCSDLLQWGSDVTANATFPYSISVSYGSQKIDFCPAETISRLSDDVQKMSSMGVTVMISSGDDGSGHSTRQGSNAGKVSPSFPASIPYAVAVGSTYFVSGTSGEEEASTQFGSGGGFSYDYGIPDYQQDAVTKYLAQTAKPASGIAYASGRGTPDVSLLGEQFNVMVNGKYEAVGGTSASSPSFGAIVSLLNEVCLASGDRSLGFILPLLYNNTDAFTDITKGTSAIGSNKAAGVWACEEGWDAATGIGTPDFAKLATVVERACSGAGPAPVPPVPTLPPTPPTPKPPVTPAPPEPPAPPGTFIQKQCTDAACTDCDSIPFPLGLCLPTRSGGSALISTCTSAGLIEELFASSTDCSGTSTKKVEPVDKCAKASTGDSYFENECASGAAAALRPGATYAH